MASQRSTRASQPAAIRTYDACPLLNIVGQDERTVLAVIGVVYFLTIQFCEQNQSERVINVGRRVCEYVAQTDSKIIVLQSGGMIHTRKWKELNFHFRDRCPWPEFA